MLCLFIQDEESSLPAMPESRGIGREKYPIYNIPCEIRPKLSKFKLEVSFSM